jgi:taurine dioxygenase
MRDSQLAFARCFGDLETYPAGERSHPQIVRIEHGVDAPPTENIWHSDMSFRKDPPLGAVLRGIDVPEVGGDTLFADMRDVWTRVPEKIQTVARGLGAHHDIAKWADASVAESLREAAPIVTHPIVRVHPETKEELLFVNAAYTTAVAGMDAADSAALLDFLFRQVTVPEVQCRVRWEPGTVVLWDNRSVQHYAAGDYLPAGRIMERVSIAGDPVQGAG